MSNPLPRSISILVLGLCLLPLTLAPSCKTQSEASSNSTVLQPNPEEGSPSGEKDSETNTQNPSDLLQWPDESQKVVELKRTPCFGKCPVDHTIVYADGTVRYVGTQNVGRQGLYKGKLPIGRWDGVLDQARMMDFWNLAERYPTGDNRIMDLPSEQLWFSDGEQSKRVINQRYANPDAEGEQQIVERLNSLSASIVQLLEEANLTLVQGPPGGME